MQTILAYRKMEYNKLVRDHIVSYITSRGVPATYHIATTEEYEQKLIEKLYEEIQEFVHAPSLHKKSEEIADILEVIDALCHHFGIEKETISSIKEQKKEKSEVFMTASS